MASVIGAVGPGPGGAAQQRQPRTRRRFTDAAAPRRIVAITARSIAVLSTVSLQQHARLSTRPAPSGPTAVLPELAALLPGSQGVPGPDEPSQELRDLCQLQLGLLNKLLRLDGAGGWSQRGGSAGASGGTGRHAGGLKATVYMRVPSATPTPGSIMLRRVTSTAPSGSPAGALAAERRDDVLLDQLAFQKGSGPQDSHGNIIMLQLDANQSTAGGSGMPDALRHLSGSGGSWNAIPPGASHLSASQQQPAFNATQQPAFHPPPQQQAGGAQSDSAAAGAAAAALGHVDAEACLASEEVLMLPSNGSLVLPLVDGSNLVGLLLVEQQAPYAQTPPLHASGAHQQQPQLPYSSGALLPSGEQHGLPTAAAFQEQQQQQQRQWQDEQGGLLPQRAAVVPSVQQSAEVVAQVVAPGGMAGGGAGGSPLVAQVHRPPPVTSVTVVNQPLADGHFITPGPAGVPTTLVQQEFPGYTDEEIHALRVVAPLLAKACAMELRSASSRTQAMAAGRLVRDAARPASALQTFSAMLLPRTGEGTAERDLVRGIASQGKRLQELLRQLDAALAPAPSGPALGSGSAMGALSGGGVMGASPVLRGSNTLGGAVQAPQLPSPGTSPPLPAPRGAPQEALPAAAQPSLPAAAFARSRAAQASLPAPAPAPGPIPAASLPPPIHTAPATSIIPAQPSSSASSSQREERQAAAASHPATQSALAPAQSAHAGRRQPPAPLLHPATTRHADRHSDQQRHPRDLQDGVVIDVESTHTASSLSPPAQQQTAQAQPALVPPPRPSGPFAAAAHDSKQPAACDLLSALAPILTAAAKLARATGVHFVVHPPLHLLLPQAPAAKPSAPTQQQQQAAAVEVVAAGGRKGAGGGRTGEQVPRLRARPQRPLHVALHINSLQRIVALVIDLAMQCTPRGGAISVSASALSSAAQRWVRLEVAHTGHMVTSASSSSATGPATQHAQQEHGASGVVEQDVISSGSDALVWAADHGAGAAVATASSARLTPGSGLLSWLMAAEMVAKVGGRVDCQQPVTLLHALTGQAERGTRLVIELPAA